jgi:hypothetical protein
MLMLLVLGGTNRMVAATYVWNTHTDSLYNNIISLKLKGSKQTIATEGYANLNNYLLEDYIGFLEVFLSEDEQVFERFEVAQEKRFGALKKGDGKSPWHMYVQAEMNLHFALASLKIKNYYDGFMGCRKAWKLYHANRERFPHFKPNHKGIATLKAIMGIIPSQYQWGVSLLGLEGDLKGGMERLRQLSSTPFEFRLETTLIYTSLLIHLEGKHDEAWQAIGRAGYPLSGNLFTYYTAANAAIYSKHNENALAMLANRPKGEAYAAFPFMEHLYGLALINSLDTNCRAHLNKYLAQTSNQNNIKNAFQKLAWSYLIVGDTAQYKKQIGLAKIKGLNELDADKQAQKEAESGQVPDVPLLKARLLFDGGYFEKALAMIHDKTPANYTTKPLQLELVYRKGRIYDAMGKQTEAIANYKETIKLGEREPLYFAANAALNLGFIYEKVHDKTQARYYYNLCINLKDHEYYSGLSQKAKSGLERVR